MIGDLYFSIVPHSRNQNTKWRVIDFRGRVTESKQDLPDKKERSCLAGRPRARRVSVARFAAIFPADWAYL